MKWNIEERWHTLEDKNDVLCIAVHEEGAILPVCYMQSSGHIRECGVSANEARQRARLIAAAPGLRAAAEFMYQVSAPAGWATAEQREEAREALRLAILAAYGKDGSGGGA